MENLNYEILPPKPLDSLEVGEFFKYRPSDAGIFKVVSKDDKNWIVTIRMQTERSSERSSGDFRSTMVHPYITI